MPHVVSGKLKIVNVYDTSFELSGLDIFSNYSVDGVVFSSLAALQNALLPVIYTRNSLNFESDLPYYNQITKENGITNAGLKKTFLAGWEWLINNVQYINTGDIEITFPLASTGKQRLDRVVATNLNTFIRIPGAESISSPTADPRPDNTIDATFVLVTDSEVNEPTPPVIGDGKEDKVNKNQPNGYAGLDSFGKINFSQIPNLTTDNISEGVVNKYSTLSLVMSYVLTGVSFTVGTAITATDTVLSAFGKLQKQINDLITGKQVIDEQIEIIGNSNVLNAWSGKTVLFTANCTITVPATLNNQLNFPFIVYPGVTVTWSITSPFSWVAPPTPTVATADLVFGMFVRKLNSNTVSVNV
ncbi:hypothetical protein C4F50_23970 [Flavobacterium sp. KB82]|uniref:Uncharacterized protein n=2 Tax=Flavobacterium hungaricum TaxID=2082725 RepID=A0ABR9TRT7_9FLAO|nr:hypothetical protein [Flavobacterium hungaricum]